MQCVWEEEIKAWIAQHKLASTNSLLAVMYTSVKSGEALFPFTISKADGQLTVTYLSEPPASYTCANEDAVKILLLVLDRLLREKSA